MLEMVTRLQPTWIRGCAAPGGVPVLPGGGTGLSPHRAAVPGAGGAGSEQSATGGRLGQWLRTTGLPPTAPRWLPCVRAAWRSCTSCWKRWAGCVVGNSSTSLRRRRCCRRRRPSSSWSRSCLGCSTCTGAASPTSTSSPRTSCCRRRMSPNPKSRSSTSAWPRSWRMALPSRASAGPPSTSEHRGHHLHPGETDAETLSNVVEGAYDFEERYFSDTSEMAKDFIRQLLVKEPQERMTASECLVHPWIKPLSRKQAAKRSRSSINMKNFRKFNARRKWKLSYHMVSACNRLCRMRLLCSPRTEGEELRCCESDQEEEGSHPVTLLRRRRSSCS
ncbi:uncharacterized protein LOC110387943 isoform X2 [Numida meleagris]|uniref:uncharacterized protein LOC110387943 isoform X2 n=1 Tax=Numida meleagris TaxID=8996 RepID=UPI000B3E332A|nr:uncharacterized protein LOC110387943 isoform X2 [Numida meleagris]